ARTALGPSLLMVRYLAGALNRIPPEATAIAQRDSEALVMTTALVPREEAQAGAAWVDGIWEGVAAHADGSYSGFALRHGPELLARFYPPTTLARLAEAKRRWDPDNLFRGNHNIPPAG